MGLNQLNDKSAKVLIERKLMCKNKLKLLKEIIRLYHCYKPTDPKILELKESNFVEIQNKVFKLEEEIELINNILEPGAIVKNEQI